MSGRVRTVVALVVVAGLGLLLWRLIGRDGGEGTLSGYVEAESLFLAAPVAGTVTSISAPEGGRVQAGEQLFTIDPATLSAQGQQARAQIQAARTGIASAQAGVEQAEAEAAAAAAEAERARRDLSRLLAVRSDDPAAVAGKEIDSARAALREANARLSAARDLVAARRSQVGAARAEVEVAEGGAKEVRIRVDQLSPVAPVDARVEEVYFQRGEWVAANQPVVSLLPDDGVKLRFFVPQGEINRYRPGRQVRFTCDGCPDGMTARISYVSPTPEFTPPVIFSRDTRDRLVFMVEATPSRANALRPGLPIDVVPLGQGSAQ